jgi:cell division protein FtsB
MTRKQCIVLSVAAFILGSLLLFIIFGEHGYIDLNSLKRERDQLHESNNRIREQNVTLSIEIDRLKNDPKYIENVARHELGMVGKDELILKPRSLPRP